MVEGEDKEKREMGEIMPMKPPIPVVIEEEPIPLLPFPPKDESVPKSLTLFNVDKRHRLIRKLNREEKSVEEIMGIVGVSRSTVNKVLNKTRPKPKPKMEAKKKTTVAPPVPPTIQPEPHPKRRASLRGTAADYKERSARIKELHDAGKTTEEIKAEIGCSSSTVNRIVGKFHKASPSPPRGRGNYGPRKYPPARPPAPPAPKETLPEPALWHGLPLKRPVGRPRIHPQEIIVTLHRPKGFWGWIIRFAERMMIGRSRRRAQKAAKMLGLTPESVQVLLKKKRPGQ